jgi:nitroreductase/NAD-dependent dihydropyrimidine dehydrogenase PreA subunit
MGFLEINKNTCSKCGACAAACPVGLFNYQEKEYPHPVPDAMKFCIRCGHCVVICPTKSVIHRECPLDKYLPINEKLNVNFEQCNQLIKSRRSIRVYQDKPVNREIITKLVDTARYAPTGGNSQGVHWLVFDDKEQIRRFSEIGIEWMQATSKMNPEAGARFANTFRLHDAGKDGFLRGAPVLVVAIGEKSNPGAANSCILALSYFDLAANSMGLGCTWAGFFMHATSFPPMAKEIALPEGYQVCGAIMLGYPEYRYQMIPVRKPARITWRP